MRIRILEAAENDLMDGYHFYELQSFGLGSYFLDTLYSDIDSLFFYGGVHPKLLSLLFVTHVEIPVLKSFD